MKKFDILSLVRELSGGVEAVAETNADQRIKKNLEEYCELHGAMLEDIITSAKGMCGRYQYSVKEISDYARTYLKDIYEEIGEYLHQFEIEEEIEKEQKESAEKKTKEKQTPIDKYSLPIALDRRCFHGEIWISCPECGYAHEAHDNLTRHPDDNDIFICRKCGKYFRV